MGKTFRRNEGRRPKWDKHGRKSHKQREYEEEKFKFKPQHFPKPETEPESEFPEPQDLV